MSPTDPAPLRAVLLDLDGTLVDSHPALRSAYRRFVTGHGGAPSDEEYERWNGPPLAAIVAGLQSTHGIAGDPSALLDEYVRLLEGSYLAETRLQPGATALLDELGRRSIAAALVTSAPASLAHAMLAARGIEHRFAAIVAGDDVAEGKPAPDGYRAALGRLGVAPAEAVAVEDTATGVASAVGAGVRCLGVGPGGALLLRAGALAAAADLGEVAAILAALARGPGRVWPARAVSAEVHEEPGALRDPGTEARVAAAWAAACLERPSLVDGEIVSVASIRPGATSGEPGGGGDSRGGVLRIEAGLTRYRMFVAARAGVPVGLCTLGVAGLTILHHDLHDGVHGSVRASERGSGGPQLILGRRSDWVTQYPSCWEPVPSGGVSRRHVGPGGAVDLEAQVLEELAEELGVPPGQVRRIRTLGAVEDLAERVVDVAFRLDIVADAASLAARVAPYDEYRQLTFLPLDAVLRDRSLLGNLPGGGGLVPTIGGLLDLLAGT